LTDGISHLTLIVCSGVLSQRLSSLLMNMRTVNQSAVFLVWSL